MVKNTITLFRYIKFAHVRKRMLDPDIKLSNRIFSILTISIEMDKSKIPKIADTYIGNSIGSTGEFVPIYISVRYTFTELYMGHFVPQPFSILHAT